MEKETTQLLLRIPADLKAELQAQADQQGRKLTQEINIRLRNSLAHGVRDTAAGTSYATPLVATLAGQLSKKAPTSALTDIDRAMLDVFHTMPPDKQLALLTLFR